MKKIIIAGAGGMLGEAFYNEFKNDYNLTCTDIDLNESWLIYNDFRDLESYKELCYKINPDILIHLGAHTDLEFCEVNEKETYETNTISVENATFICNELDIPLVYISTAGIFDGQKDSYDDWDKPNPLCVYARTKYLGEEYVVQNCKRYYVFRAGWMMGGHKKDKKFIYKIINQIKGGAKELNVVDDKNGTPTYTVDFARNVKQVINKNLFGVYNLVCGGLTSRFEVAVEILKILNLDSKIKLRKVSSEHFEKEYFVKRPKSERLINKKLDLRGLNMMRDWKEALVEYLSDINLNE
jgi:dTDP-4-dehydrorhamnose reductase